MAKSSFKLYVERELGKFPHFVIYVLLEWFLIMILFIDGFLAFFGNEFAKFFELKIPCLLCTRIDHVLVQRSPDFYYNDSICDSHKKSISNRAYCHAHKKLTEIKKMCEACLLSFATEKECDCDTYKSLVGILHKDLELLVDDDGEFQASLPSARKKDDAVAVSEQRNTGAFDARCMCCGELLKVRSSASKAKRAGLFSQQAPVPSPRASFNHRNLDLPHVKYTELKVSDNESDVHDEDDSTGGMNRARDDVRDASVPLLTDPEDAGDDKTSYFARGGNRFFGIPLSDSAQNSPRWSIKPVRKSILDRSENNASDSMDANVSQDVSDGDSILNHLKKQVRLDRKSLIALYMELDEERSASAVAANNAMAMITRLQAEKAAVQMEALQYQRLMEEQAEYDQEALQATKELLLKREEEIKELEAELNAYREKFGCLRDENDDDCFAEGREHSSDDDTDSTVEYSGKSEPVHSSNTDNDRSPERDQTEHSDENQVSFPEYASGNPTDETGRRNKSGLPEELCDTQDRLKADESDGVLSNHNTEGEERFPDKSRGQA